MPIVPLKLIYLLYTLFRSDALLAELEASSTVLDRFHEWEQTGFFKDFWQPGLEAYDELKGIVWQW